jgi:antitoxin component of MazEF toxin-antitoxin module
MVCGGELMRALQKLTRNGNSTTVVIPRPLMFYLGWLPGQAIILEVLEDKSVRLRIPVESDFMPRRPPRMVLDASLPGVA